jgi:hypothetical protein
MSRDFTDADLIQHNSGALPGTTTTATVSLTNPTVEGNTVIVHLRNYTTVAYQDQWQLTVAEQTIPALQILTRPDVVGGENSWDLILNQASPPASAGSTFWLWRAEEWANIDFLPVVSTGSAADLSPTTSPFAAGNTAAFTGESSWLAFALISFYKAVADSQPWPTISALTNGFVVDEYIDYGNGTEATGSGLLGGRLAVCHVYGNGDGPVTTSATLSGTISGVNTQGVVAVYRAMSAVTASSPAIVVS